MSFFDKHPVLYPWSQLLRRSGLKLVYKPREVWWKGWLKKLELKVGDKVLEVGCGRGVFLDRLTTEYGLKAFGVDIAEKAITEGKNKSVNRLNLRVADACQLPFSQESFDAVISFDTLEHIKDPASAEASAGKQEKAITEMVRVLKPGGKILVYTINSRQKFTWNWLLNKFGVEVYKNVDHNLKLFVDPEWLKKELEKEGVRILAVDYFNSFFSLAVDEVIMIFLKSWQKFFGWEKTENFGKITLGILSTFSVIATPLWRILELPWTILGYSNSFLIIGIKKK